MENNKTKSENFDDDKLKALKEHSNDRRKCGTCNKSFASGLQLTRHMKKRGISAIIYHSLLVKPR